MSDKRGPAPTGPYPGATPGVSYPQMVASQNPPPSYVESLNHPVVAGNHGVQQYQQYVSQATAAATAAQLQSAKIEEYMAMITYMQSISEKDQASLAYYQNLAAAQQAQKLAYSQQAAYQQQQQSALYAQQQQLYLQQLQGCYGAPPQHPYQHGQNVLVLGGPSSNWGYPYAQQAARPGTVNPRAWPGANSRLRESELRTLSAELPRPADYDEKY